MRVVALTGALLTALSFAGVLTAVAGTKATSSWVAPDLTPGSCRKVLSMARFTDESAKRILEDTVVKELKLKGLDALAAYQALGPENLASHEAVEAKAPQLGVESGIVFSVTGESTEVKSGATGSAGIGVPVSAGPFSVFLGTTSPSAADHQRPRWSA